jgi:hypothetical protein
MLDVVFTLFRSTLIKLFRIPVDLAAHAPDDPYFPWMGLKSLWNQRSFLHGMPQRHF